jgi:hypothetical protein
VVELIGIGERSFQIERWCCKEEDIGEYWEQLLLLEVEWAAVQ